MRANITYLASRASGQNGTGGDRPANIPSLSADGRWVGFHSEADNLSGNDIEGGVQDVYLRDVLGSPAPAGSQPAGGGTGGGGTGLQSPGGGGGFGGLASGRDASPPIATFTGRLAQSLAGQRGRLVVRVGCLNEACVALVTGRVTVPTGTPRSFRLEGRTVSLKAGTTATVRLTLSRTVLAAARRALRRGKRVRARFTERTRDSAGNMTAKGLTIRLRR